MGFLQHDTNNIILDAVLTDIGRRFLSRNDGSFSITKFALADDEVDYKIIQRYGREVGKEKIEKNTPILEAITNPNMGQKYKLIGIANPNITRLPSITLVQGVDSDSILNLSTADTTFKKCVIEQQINDNAIKIPAEIQDQYFKVMLDFKFLRIQGATPDSIDPNQRATYTLPRDGGLTPKGGAIITFVPILQPVPSAHFTTYGTTSNKNLIRTFIKVMGNLSGQVIDFEAKITRPTG
jgi:hypothetical protein